MTELGVTSQAQVTHGVHSNKVVVTGSVLVTGTSVLNIDTGLRTIDEVFLTVKETTQTAGAAAYATYDHGADGLLDIYCWEDDGSTITVDTTVCWQVWGTK